VRAIWIASPRWSAAAALPGLNLAGKAYCGVGIPDSVHSGEAAAERLLAVSG
jgi:protoporphyrinogen/coproporphyrinogen III oxidase